MTTQLKHSPVKIVKTSMGFRGHADGTNNPQLFNLPGKLTLWDSTRPSLRSDTHNHPYIYVLDPRIWSKVGPP